MVSIPTKTIHMDLQGHLKAAEAKERLRDYRRKADKRKAAEIRELVSCQASAMDAIRLERLIQQVHLPKPSHPPMGPSKSQAERIAQLMAEGRTWLPS